MSPLMYFIFVVSRYTPSRGELFIAFPAWQSSRLQCGIYEGKSFWKPCLSVLRNNCERSKMVIM